MRVLETDQERFSVQVGPDAWRQIGAFNREAFAAIRGALEVLSNERRPDGQLEARDDDPYLRSVLVGRLVVLCHVDLRARLVTVVRLEKSLPAANAV